MCLGINFIWKIQVNTQPFSLSFNTNELVKGALEDCIIAVRNFDWLLALFQGHYDSMAHYSKHQKCFGSRLSLRKIKQKEYLPKPPQIQQTQSIGWCISEKRILEL